MEVMNEQKENKNKQRFKGIENFLRRIAFNLGNTPSQTEVKIISCIPIDVTDLQQKIIQLERQLDGVATAPKEVIEAEPEPRKSAISARKESGANKSVKEAAVTKSSNEEKTSKHATETGKEKDTEAKTKRDSKSAGSKKSTAGSQKKTTIVNTAFYDSNFDYSSTSASKKEESEPPYQNLPSRSYTDKQGKSTVSFIFPALSNNGDHCMISSDEVYHDDKKIKNDFRKNLFNIRRKRSKKKKYNKTEFVYYAETDNLNNNLNSNVNQNDAPKNNAPVNRAYLNDVIRKQFKLGMILEKLSDTSEFSSPVCRDDEQAWNGPCPYESDVCSCFHGPFRNIDYVASVPFNQSKTNLGSATINNRDVYYDSSLYDVVPVKEKPIKTKKNVASTKRKEGKIDMKCWPEIIRTKPRFQPYVVNYHTLVPGKDIGRPERSNNKRDTKNITTKRCREVKVDEQINNDTSESCCIDLGEVQIKKIINKKITTTQSECVGPVYKNVECITTSTNNADCQTTSSSVQDTNTLDKTEETLNNIKSILQSVLTEVKTNSQIKQTGHKAKKDAVVQKGVSQSNLQGCSRLLNCLTYSPFNMNPYDATCSRLMSAGHPYCTMQQPPMKCMHNYPVFINSAGRRRCSSCFRNSHVAKFPADNVTIATNTEEIKEEHSKETEKLIKEIYRSMALTMDLPTKETSYSNYDDLKSLTTTPVSTYSKSNNNKDLQLIISEIFKKPSPKTESSATRGTTTTLNKIVSNCVSVQSQGISTDDDRRVNMHRINREAFIKEEDDDFNDDEDDEIDNDDEDNSTETETNDKPSLTDLHSIDAADNESSSNESESQNTVSFKGSVKEKKKSGLLSKMFKSVFKTKDKKKQPKVTVTKSETSDSEDYQTIYSHKTEKLSRPSSNRTSKKSHSKIMYARQRREKSPERFKRPYMEQEYRRHWNEKLMFKDRALRYSSEQPLSAKSKPRRPVYHQNYEARSLMVEPDRYNAQRSYRQLPFNNDTKCGVSYPYEARPECSKYQIQRNLRNNVWAKKDSPTKVTGKGLAWLKKHKMGIHCGEQWKKLILEG